MPRKNAGKRRVGRAQMSRRDLAEHISEVGRDRKISTLEPIRLCEAYLLKRLRAIAPEWSVSVVGNDVDHPPAITVQLFPFDDTPNNGGVYKVWVTRVEDYGCFPDLSQVDCAVGKHGFIPSHTKTDNFKVKGRREVPEIDTRFFNDRNQNGWRDEGDEFLDGMQVKWIDTLGASNMKSSYLAPEINVFHEAHVEAVEDGTHQFEIFNQPNCTVGSVYVDGEFVGGGPQTVSVPLSRRDGGITIFVDVACEQ